MSVASARSTQVKTIKPLFARAWGDPAFGYPPQATIGPLDTPPYAATAAAVTAM